tara:strand:- start:396 stop:641 length:246 start_codon:yes stop_codon:yes gene_type:complete
MEQYCAPSQNQYNEPKIPQDFYQLMAERKHIEFERADLQNNILQLEYFYTHHKEFCEYHMKFTEGIFQWNNYTTFLKTKLV